MALSFLDFNSYMQIFHTLSKTIIVITKPFSEANIIQNNIFKVKTTGVRGPTLARLAMVSVVEAGGKPSTWFPPQRLVELTSHARRMQISSDDFLMKKLEFSKNLKMSHFSNFSKTFPVHST